MAVHAWDGNAWQTSGDSGQAAKPVATPAGAVHQWDGKAWVTSGSTEGCGVSVVDDNRGPPGPAGAPGAPGATGATGPNVHIADTPPPAAIPGDLWWESDSGALSILYNDGSSTQWVETGGTEVSQAYVDQQDLKLKAYIDTKVSVLIADTPPVAKPGDMWWEATTGSLYVYYDDGNSLQWVEAGGEKSTTTTLRRIRDLEATVAELKAKLDAA